MLAEAYRAGSRTLIYFSALGRRLTELDHRDMPERAGPLLRRGQGIDGPTQTLPLPRAVRVSVHHGLCTTRHNGVPWQAKHPIG